MMPNLRQEKGMALLMVLVVVTLLSSLLTEFAFSTLVDLRLTETFRDSTRAYYLAKGGIRVGQMILREDRNGYDAPDELWARGVNGYPVGDGNVSIGITDLGGKLDINRLVDAQGKNPDAVFIDRFVRFFDDMDREHPGVFFNSPGDLVGSLIDWIDRDDTIYSGEVGTGAEDAYYRRLENPYPCKNRPLDTLDELEMVRGFTPESVRLIRPHVTIHGGDQINVNTASAEVLMTLSQDPPIDREIAEAIISRRESEPFKKTEDLKELNTLPGMENLLRDPFTIFSDTYRISSWGEVGDGVRRMEAVVAKSGNRLLYLKVN